MNIHVEDGIMLKERLMIDISNADSRKIIEEYVKNNGYVVKSVHPKFFNEFNEEAQCDISIFDGFEVDVNKE